MLELEEVRSAYGRIEVLHGVSLEVRAGEIVALVGANGAGKSTLLKAISGVQPITNGRMRFAGEPLERVRAHARVGLGIAQVPEGRQLFTPLSVEDNLLLGAWVRRSAPPASQLDRVYALFPMLAELRKLAAGSLSGGQQQMLAVGRALMAGPRLLLLDEPSMGLAPILVAQILEILGRLKRDGVTVLLVEQNARAALSIADRGYVMETGRVTASGSAGALLADNRVRAAFLGL
ncbi:MAG TPA: ABC transporter ATP-binding protein [Xanthobacteraceae bacterium]|nr:ABC transporter ATP-binding protein [Xanthobacteraceae bacterium]